MKRAIALALMVMALSSGIAGARKKTRRKSAPPPATAPATIAPAPAPAPAPATPTAVPPSTAPPGPAAPASPPSVPSPDFSARTPASHPATPSGTHCILCHTVQSWSDVRFPHERTGFALNGGHRRVPCKACHPVNFRVQVPERCAGCHRDAHAGEFGARCEGCHDENSWRTTFNADAHRATNFPLAGAHAMIPCTECHPQARDRGFARAKVNCQSCHLKDFDRAALTTIDHNAAGFSTECRRCHSTFAFSPARYPDHDRCFKLSNGPHANVRCLACHISAPSVAMLGLCSTNNTACTACHAHSAARTDPRHTGVPGYAYVNRKCYECHHALGGL